MTTWGGSEPLTVADLRRAAELMSMPYRADPPPVLTTRSATEYRRLMREVAAERERQLPKHLRSRAPKRAADTTRHPNGEPPDVGYLFEPLRWTRTDGAWAPMCPPCAARLDWFAAGDFPAPDRTQMPGALVRNWLDRHHANLHQEDR